MKASAPIRWSSMGLEGAIVRLVSYPICFLGFESCFVAAEVGWSINKGEVIRFWLMMCSSPVRILLRIFFRKIPLLILPNTLIEIPSLNPYTILFVLYIPFLRKKVTFPILLGSFVHSNFKLYWCKFLYDSTLLMYAMRLWISLIELLDQLTLTYMWAPISHTTEERSS